MFIRGANEVDLASQSDEWGGSRYQVTVTM